MGLVFKGIPEQLALRLADKYNLTAFLETGTLKGNTALWASKHFEQVVTIEFDFYLWVQAQERLRRHKVWCIRGDSRESIEVVLNRFILMPALIWLDAHWSRDLGYNRPELGECPVLQEIEQINQDARRHVIMIDDARLFTSPPPKPHRANDWPSYDEIKNLLNAGKFPRIIEIIHDVIVAIPA